MNNILFTDVYLLADQRHNNKYILTYTCVLYMTEKCILQGFVQVCLLSNSYEGCKRQGAPLGGIGRAKYPQNFNVYLVLAAIF